VARGVLFLPFGEPEAAGAAIRPRRFRAISAKLPPGTCIGFFNHPFRALLSPTWPSLGFLVGVLQVRIGVTLVLGLEVRLGSVVGALFVRNLATLVPNWIRSGVWFCFSPFPVFYAAGAGQTGDSTAGSAKHA
jgi:uncharacterized membrane protein YphA (DoxX/SURF4 family)